ncbi:MAG: hypothetical protein ACOCYQ_05835, partial [Alkalispirochaeta sp.]
AAPAGPTPAAHAAEGGPAAHPADRVRPLGELLRFYVPLSLTSIMALVSRPILAYGIARSGQPLESLATWPVINSLLFLFTSVALSYQEAVVAKMSEDRRTEGVLIRFGVLLTGALTALFGVIALTGGAGFWFRTVAGLEPALVALARPAMVVLVVMPLAVTGRTLFSGMLVAAERTSFLSFAVLANTVVLLTLVMVLPAVTDLVGTITAAIAFAAANVAQLVVLWGGYRWSRHRSIVRL